MSSQSTERGTSSMNADVLLARDQAARRQLTLSRKNRAIDHATSPRAAGRSIYLDGGQSRRHSTGSAARDHDAVHSPELPLSALPRRYRTTPAPASLPQIGFTEVGRAPNRQTPLIYYELLCNLVSNFSRRSSLYETSRVLILVFALPRVRRPVSRRPR